MLELYQAAFVGDPGPPEPDALSNGEVIGGDAARDAPTRQAASPDTPEVDSPTTWEPIDLGPFLRGDYQRPQPTVGLARSDGQKLIYAGAEHVVIGETESGKSWLALACVAVELRLGNRVLYVHYEESDPGSTVERLRLLGTPVTDIARNLTFVAPSRASRAGWLAELLAAPAPTLVVHDGVNEAMSLHGADIMAADGAATFRRNLITPCLRAGAATLSCDHVVKNSEGRGRDAYGSVHKGNALDGARIVLENVDPFGRGLRGVSHVFVTKDRPGHLRAQGKPTKIPGKTFLGTLVVDGTPGAGPDVLMFWAPTDREEDDGHGDASVTLVELGDIVHGVIAALPDGKVGSQRQLFAEMRRAGQSHREQAIRMAVDDLLVAGRLTEVPGRRGSSGYQAVSTAARASDNAPPPATAARECGP